MSQQATPKRGEKRLTLADIAEAAGVSVPTVSKVIHKRGDISTATREHIERIIKEMGYVAPEVQADEPKRKRRNTLLLTMGIVDEYSLEIQRGVMQALQGTPMHLIVTESDNLQSNKRWVSHALGGGVDGVLIIGGSEYIERVRKQKIPLVIADPNSAADPAIPTVGATNLIGARSAIQYLIGLGHRRIGIINGLPGNIVSNERLMGYRVALDMAGIAPDPELIRPGWYGVESGFLQANELLDLADPPTAIFTGNDGQALGVYQALYERGVTVPKNMSVIGFDDLPIAAYLTPPLTTIRQPLLEMGRVATNMLLRLIAGETLDASHIELATTLMKRSSCTPPLEKR